MVRTYRTALRGFELTRQRGAGGEDRGRPASRTSSRTTRCTRPARRPTRLVGPGPDRPARPAAEPVLHLPEHGARTCARTSSTPASGSPTSDFGGRATSGFDAVDGGNGRRLQRPRHARRRHGRRHHVRRRQGRPAGRRPGAELPGQRHQRQVIARHRLGHGQRGQAGRGQHEPRRRRQRRARRRVNNSINSGVTYAIAAGNGNILGLRQNACNFSPARVPDAITVGATQINDAAAIVLELRHLPGHLRAGRRASPRPGRPATPRPTRSAARRWRHRTWPARPPCCSRATRPGPQQVRDELVNNSTPNVVTNPGTGSPNRLLFVVNDAPPASDFAVSVSPTSGAVVIGGSTTATVGTSTTPAPPSRSRWPRAACRPARRRASPGDGHLGRFVDDDDRHLGIDPAGHLPGDRDRHRHLGCPLGDLHADGHRRAGAAAPAATATDVAIPDGGGPAVLSTITIVGLRPQRLGDLDGGGQHRRTPTAVTW